MYLQFYFAGVSPSLLQYLDRSHTCTSYLIFAASSITTDGPTVHISQSEMTQVVTMIGKLPRLCVSDLCWFSQHIL